MTLFHATCVSLGNGGILLRGPSGMGKSDLALQLVDSGARLVADDYVVLSSRDKDLIAAAPNTIRGLLEVRGVGVIEVPFVSSCIVHLMVDLVTSKDVPRLPEPATELLEGIAIPRVALCPRETSAIAKIRIALLVSRSHIRRV